MERRQFLIGAAAGVISVGAGTVPARAGRRQGPPSVAVFGGGVAGLTAAHELAERGVRVSLYERRAWGGKARSTEVPGTGTGGRRPLPGEHGYRMTFGFYQNLPDMMRRIPFGSNPHGVFDNLVAAPQLTFARTQAHDLVLPLGQLDPRPYTPTQVVDTLIGILVEQQIPAGAAAYYINRIATWASSCDARRRTEWQSMSWAEFVRANEFGDDYRNVLGSLPQFIQASKPDETSAAFVAAYQQLLLFAVLGMGTNGPCQRVLDGPTDETWIDPWMAQLGRLGVECNLGAELLGLELSDGRICSARVGTPTGETRVLADHYVIALPLERARALWTPAIRMADPRLATMDELPTGWMNGIMFFLRAPCPIAAGAVSCADSPWAVSFVTQGQFWAEDFGAAYGDGTVRDKLSAIVADWDRPGILYGKAARDCTPEEVATETWAQLKAHVGEHGLTDDLLHSWDIDPGMLVEHGRLVSDDPLVLPSRNTLHLRPTVETGVPNLYLCGDYLDGDWEVANMEAACFNGRRATNAVLRRSGSSAPAALELPPHDPPVFRALRAADDVRFRLGQRNLFDEAAPALAQLAEAL